MLPAIAFLAALLFSAALTRVVRRYAVCRQLLDHPDSRRLHDAPTPRGGGAAILISVTGVLAVLFATGHLPGSDLPLALAFGIAFGTLGWLDDHSDLAVAPRLLAQFGFAFAFVLGCVLIADVGFESGWHATALLGFAVAVGAIAWFVNLFNFMDGADGFAAGTSVAAALAGAAIAGATGAPDTMLSALVIAGATAGFLFWNWSPARLFMGDVGSYFLGFQFCALAAHDVLAGRGPWLWLILFAPFITDASLTLALRMIRRERFWQAHRSHVYQLIILAGRSHAQVSAGAIVITLAVLAPLAAFATVHSHWALPITAATYALNGMLWLFARHRYA